ncbi:MAG TPA: hypothetical protein VN924_07390 [Bryobacteraceae bacterium]|nr:hypothetical protein [Bryobacteraceae bacterium]
MIPNTLQPLFWDTDVSAFQPLAYPDYTIFRVLEYGDDLALAWLRDTFGLPEICRVIRTERRLSPKSASFWALVYGIAEADVAALVQ